jgi:hypothetical protein
MRKLKEPSDENQTECHEIEPNPSKDKAGVLVVVLYKYLKLLVVVLYKYLVFWW